MSDFFDQKGRRYYALLKIIFASCIFLSLTVGCAKSIYSISYNTHDKSVFVVSGHLINHKFFIPDYQGACRMVSCLDIDDSGGSLVNKRYYFPKTALNVWESEKITAFSDVCLLTDFHYCSISGVQNEQYFAFRNNYTPNQHCFFK